MGDSHGHLSAPLQTVPGRSWQAEQGKGEVMVRLIGILPAFTIMLAMLLGVGCASESESSGTAVRGLITVYQEST